MKEDLLVGGTAATAGTGGLTVQWAIGMGNLTLIAINIILALGGCYLVYLRIRQARQDQEKKKPGD